MCRLRRPSAWHSQLPLSSASSQAGNTVGHRHHTTQKPGGCYITVHKLFDQLAHIPQSLTNGFIINAPYITATSMPSNHPSIKLNYSTFSSIIEAEFAKGCYLGPFSREALEGMLGPFQTSPLLIIPKPGKPNKFHLIQNLSYPRDPM